MLKQQVLDSVKAVKLAVQDLAVDATLVVRGDPTYVPGSAPTYGTSNVAVKVVLSSFEFKEIDGDRIRASDVQGLVFPEEGKPIPKPNDQLTISSVTYRIISNERVMAGDEAALSRLQLRIA